MPLVSTTSLTTDSQASTVMPSDMVSNLSTGSSTMRLSSVITSSDTAGVSTSAMLTDRISTDRSTDSLATTGLTERSTPVMSSKLLTPEGTTLELSTPVLEDASTTGLQMASSSSPSSMPIDLSTKIPLVSSDMMTSPSVRTTTNLPVSTEEMQATTSFPDLTTSSLIKTSVTVELSTDITSRIDSSSTLVPSVGPLSTETLRTSTLKSATATTTDNVAIETTTDLTTPSMGLSTERGTKKNITTIPQFTTVPQSSAHKSTTRDIEIVTIGEVTDATSPPIDVSTSETGPIVTEMVTVTPFEDVSDTRTMSEDTTVSAGSVETTSGVTFVDTTTITTTTTTTNSSITTGDYVTVTSFFETEKMTTQVSTILSDALTATQGIETSPGTVNATTITSTVTGDVIVDTETVTQQITDTLATTESLNASVATTEQTTTFSTDELDTTEGLNTSVTTAGQTTTLSIDILTTTESLNASIATTEQTTTFSTDELDTTEGFNTSVTTTEQTTTFSTDELDTTEGLNTSVTTAGQTATFSTDELDTTESLNMSVTTAGQTTFSTDDVVTTVDTTMFVTTSEQTTTPPIETSTCRVWGDPHYMTFDSRTFDFQGQCNYTLAKLCNDSLADGDRTRFDIVIDSQLKASAGSGSHLRQLYVTISSTTITLLQSQVVLIEGAEQRLPYFSSSGLYITYAGRYVVLSTSTGLVLRWNGEGEVTLTLPPTYSGAVCGLCGDFDGNADNDYLLPDGSLATNSTSFANGWKLDSGCLDAEPQDPCAGDADRLATAQQRCSLLATSSSSALTECQDVADLTFFYQSCLRDVCAELPGDSGGACDAYAAYHQACLDAGHSFTEEWRNATLCDLTCGSNSSTYQTCTSPCPETCPGRVFDPPCDDRCVEGCACDSGFVLEGAQCVTLDQCQCERNGVYYAAGTNLLSDTCSELCTCVNGLFQCEVVSCDTNADCGTDDSGDAACLCLDEYEGDGLTCTEIVYDLQVCTVFGGPHYVTFDDWDYTFQGDCIHTLVTTDCANGTADQTFNVTARAERDSIDNVTYTRELTVNVAGLVITMTTTDVLLDGLRVNIPFYRNNVYVTHSGEYTVIMTDIDLAVRWDGVSTAEVWLSEDYAGTVCGLCGDMDGVASNDMVLPNGTLASTVEEFGDSWSDAALTCPDTPTDVDPCDSDPARRAEAVAKCSAILNDTALFGTCYASVPLDTYYESCVYSMCVTDGDDDVFCNIIEVYATRCQLQTDWRSNDTCPYDCPLNSAYSTCISECPPSCGDFGTISQCSSLDLGCTSGCECDDGFVYKDGQCVVDSQCGCTYDGLYFRGGEEYITDGCQERCVCDGISQLMSCETIQCSFNGVCDLRDGVRACFCQGSGEAICYNVTVGYNITLIMASHSSLTLTWMTQQTVAFVIVQYRLRGIDTAWMNSSEVAGERELVILSGLESAASYDVRFLFVGEAFYSRSGISVYDTCVSDSQGAACETDYSTLSAYNFNLVDATSASLRLEWELPSVDIQFVRVQYRFDAGSPWENGTSLEPTATSNTIEGLDEFTKYEVRVFIGQTNGDAAGSAILLLLTCRGGTVGLNCAGDVPIDTGINTISSDFVTVTWTVYVEVEFIAVQYRAVTTRRARAIITVDGWTEGDPVPADRGVYNIEGLTPDMTYDYRLKLINGTQEDYGETNQVTLCSEGFQGANCEIDYSAVGAFSVRLVEASSSSLNITWKVDISILWAEVQYQLAPANLSLAWDRSETLQPTETAVLVESLAENTAYDVRVKVLRADGTTSNSDILRMKTCISGFEGLNCEIGIVMTTLASTSATETTTAMPATQPTSVATETSRMTTTLLTASSPVATTLSPTSTPITTSMPTTTPIVSSTPSTLGQDTTRLTTAVSSTTSTVATTTPTVAATTATTPTQTTMGRTSTDLPYQVVISHVNSLSITVQWSSPAGVTNVLLQYRLTGGNEWNNGSVVPVERGRYVLAGLSAETSYELRVLFEGSQAMILSNVVLASTCARGLAGETSCDTDYTSVGAFDVVLDTATSSSLAVAWSLQLQADWHIVQYRLLSATEWFNSTELTAASRLYMVQGLDARQSYVIRILTRRSTAAGRRKREDIAPNVGISAEIEALTCQAGLQGINCEEEVVPTTRMTTDQITTQTAASTDTPWRYILIGLCVAFFVLVIVIIFLVVVIYQKYKRSRSNLARIDKVNTGRVQGYRNSDVMFAADSRSFSSSEIDHEAEEADPSHVRISMVGDRNDRYDGGVRPLVQHDRRRPVDERVQRYNAAYNHDY